MPQQDSEILFSAADLTAAIEAVPNGLAGLRSSVLAPSQEISETDHSALLDLAFAAEMAMDAGLDPRPDLDQLLFDVFYAEPPLGPGDELGDAICRSGALERIDPEFVAQ